MARYRTPTYGWNDVMFEKDVGESYEKLQRHSSKQALWGMVGAFALPFLLPVLLGAAPVAATATTAGSAGTTGWLTKLFPKMFSPDKLAGLAKTHWFKPAMRGLLAGGGQALGSRMAGKPPDVLFGKGMRNQLLADQKLFGASSTAKMGKTFMGGFAASKQSEAMDKLIAQMFPTGGESLDIDKAFDDVFYKDPYWQNLDKGFDIDQSPRMLNTMINQPLRT